VGVFQKTDKKMGRERVDKVDRCGGNKNEGVDII
jgi:hypothetical protein